MLFYLVIMNNSKYTERGVSADKEDVHEAIKNVDKGLFPKAFCKIIPQYKIGAWALKNPLVWPLSRRRTSRSLNKREVYLEPLGGAHNNRDEMYSTWRRRIN